MRTKKGDADPNISKRCFWWLITKYGTVAEACRVTKLSRFALDTWRRGEFTPSIDSLRVLSELGADMNYIFKGRECK